MNIFIDGGACQGESVKFFRDTFENSDDYQIYSFESHPSNFEILSKKYPDITARKVALWIENGTTKFYISKGGPSGSSLMSNKTTGGINPNVFVECDTIDLDEWIRSNFSPDDYIVLKLDIEGAEYEVLNKMIDGGSINYINELYVEFHARKIKRPESDTTEIINKLKAIGIEPKYWCALTRTIRKFKTT